MKIAFLTTRTEKPSARYRFLQYVPYLEGEGTSIEVFTIPSAHRERQKLFKTLSAFDVVFLQKKLFGMLDWRALRKSAKSIVYDFDDAVMYKDSGSESHDSPSRLKRFEKTVAQADAVIAGNKYLEQWALRYNKRTTVIPTPIDMERYVEKDGTGDDGHVTLGWIGSSSTLLYLEGMKDVLEEVHRCYPETRLKIVADSFIGPLDMPVIEKKWDYDEEIADLKSFDIGLMPLTDDPWTRGKCAFKLLQYMAAALPAVAAPVGVNTEIIDHGINGLLVRDDAEWVECLGNLIENKDLRRSLGVDARKTVVERYSLGVNAPRMKAVLDSLTAGSG